MSTAVRLLVLLAAVQACAPFHTSSFEAINVSPCFVHLDTPVNPAVGGPRRSYVRLRDHPPDFLVAGNALEFYRDSALTLRDRRDGVWESAGRDTLRLNYLVVPTTVVTLRREDAARWTGEYAYGGDFILNGTPVIGHARVDLIPYRCP